MDSIRSKLSANAQYKSNGIFEIPTVVHLGGRKEGNILFNDALNTFYLRLYGVRHMVKDHSYSEKGNFGRTLNTGYKRMVTILFNTY